MEGIAAPLQQRLCLRSLSQSSLLSLSSPLGAELKPEERWRKGTPSVTIPRTQVYGVPPRHQDLCLSLHCTARAPGSYRNTTQPRPRDTKYGKPTVYKKRPIRHFCGGAHENEEIASSSVCPVHAQCRRVNPRGVQARRRPYLT